MKKKVVTGFIIFLGLLVVLAFTFLYSDDTVDLALSVTPEKGVNSADFLTSKEVSGSTVLEYPLTTTHGLVLNRVVVGLGPPLDNEGIFVKSVGGVNPLANDDGTMVALAESEFHNGTIEVELNGSVSPNASRLLKLFARGFIGVCFRVSSDFKSFECLYLRPENGNADDETRRNHAVQYISKPDWDFARFRKEAPEKFENPADIAPGKWHKIRIEIDGKKADLFIDDSDKPVLSVSDLKLGNDARGKVALWVGPATNGFFRNLKLTKTD